MTRQSTYRVNNTGNFTFVGYLVIALWYLTLPQMNNGFADPWMVALIYAGAVATFLMNDVIDDVVSSIEQNS